MGAFTQLGRAELGEVAADFDLGALTDFQVIAAGTINSNFRLDTERGAYFVRVNEGKAEADVAWEARLVAALAERGIPAPPPIAARDGRPYAALARGHGSSPAVLLTPLSNPSILASPSKWVSVFPWRAGSHLSPAAVTPERAAQLGAVLARMHLVGLELPPAWRRGSIYDHDHLRARFAKIERLQDPVLAPAIEILRDELAIASDAAVSRHAATNGIIHGDLFRDNVLWERDTITAVLDFEQASGGSLAYDLAVCINDWCWTDRPELELARALVAGYRGVRELTAGDRDALLIEVRAAAARFTMTRITDVYLARVANPEKDFRAFLARCQAWRGPALGQLSSVL